MHSEVSLFRSVYSLILKSKFPSKISCLNTASSHLCWNLNDVGQSVTDVNTTSQHNRRYRTQNQNQFNKGPSQFAYLNCLLKLV